MAFPPEGRRLRSISHQLYALIAAVTLPVLVGQGYHFHNMGAEMERAALEEARRLAQITGADTERFLRESETLLAQIAHREAVVAMRGGAQCDPFFKGFHERDARYANLVLVDPDGRLLCSSRPPPAGIAAPLLGNGTVVDTVQRRGPVIAQLERGPISGRPVVPLNYPVLRDGHVVGVVGMPIDAVRFYPIVASSAIPADAVVALLDRNGIFVTRSIDTEAWVGRSLESQSSLASLRQGSGSGRAPGPDGIERYYGFVPVAGTGWIAFAGIPAEPVAQEIRAQLLGQGAFSIAVLAFAMLLALVISRRIGAPIERLAAAAGAVASGEAATRARVEGAQEVAALAGQFNRMLDQLDAQQRALRESEQRLALVVDITADGIWDWDLRSNRVFFSNRFRATLGYEDEAEFRERFHFKTALHPNDRAHAIAAQDASLASGAPFDHVYRLSRRDGSYPWFHGRGQVLLDAAGKAYRFAGSITDITAQKEAEAALREQEALYRALFELAPDAVILHRERRILLANRAALQLFRAPSPGDLIGRSILDFVDAADREIADRRRCALEVEDGLLQVPLTTFRWNTVEGADIQVEVVGARVIIDGRPAVLTVARDVTEQRRAEAAQRASEARWQFALEGHGDGLWEWNAHDGSVFFSRQWKALLGYGEDELVSSMETWESLVHPDDRAEIRRAMQLHLSGALPRYYAEYRMRARDGGYLWTAANGRVMERDETGLPLRIIGTQRDISEHKRREERERQRQEQLIHSGRLMVIGEMASTLSHELNQPLTAIANYAGVCLRRMAGPRQEPAPLRDIVEKIRVQALRAGEIVWRIRDFVRKRETERLPTAIGTLIRETAALAEIEARISEVMIELAVAEGLPPVLADRLQIEQVLLNLIKNAMEAMQGVEGERWLQVAARAGEAGEIEISVSDTGHGLPDRVAMDIFTPFYTTKANGMGLGLAISRSIVEAHGGRLWATPNPAAGTTFRFTLRLADEA